MIRKRKMLSAITTYVMVVGMLFFTSNSVAYAYTLSQPKSFYDSISWTWFYSDKATPAYNCLGFATGSMTYEWPSDFGDDAATKAQLDNYLAKKGYRPYKYDPFILAYGHSPDKIVHFAKVTGLKWCRAKWGQLELFNHGSHDPYYPNSVYGSLQHKYTAN
ncbi:MULTISPECIES: DUF7689 domain-containing protein [Gardnerella]|nr:hypothetical protein [Gardnerella leopoldii]MDK7192428.1 hypothetical protein [Bifidobacterium sp. UMB1197]